MYFLTLSLHTPAFHFLVHEPHPSTEGPPPLSLPHCHPFASAICLSRMHCFSFLMHLTTSSMVTSNAATSNFVEHLTQTLGRAPGRQNRSLGKFLKIWVLMGRYRLSWCPLAFPPTCMDRELLCPELQEGTENVAGVPGRLQT